MTGVGHPDPPIVKSRHLAKSEGNRAEARRKATLAAGAPVNWEIPSAMSLA